MKGHSKHKQLLKVNVNLYRASCDVPGCFCICQHSNCWLLATKGIATRSKKLQEAPGITTSSKKLLVASMLLGSV